MQTVETAKCSGWSGKVTSILELTEHVVTLDVTFVENFVVFVARHAGILFAPSTT